MDDRRLTFTGEYIERLAEFRGNAVELAAALADPATRFLLVWQDKCPVSGLAVQMLDRDSLAGVGHDAEDLVFLGRFRGRFVFAAALSAEAAPDLPDGGRFTGLRDVLGALPADEAAVIALARAMVSWQQRHRFCGLCGAPNRPRNAGFVMACTAAACGHHSFPRLDPAIIVLAWREQHCLLGRQANWPAGRFSTIAGFVEPGESLEDAVRREVREETDIRIGGCAYVASQPWPFPASLMIGFHAEAISDTITLNDAELAEARWVTRAEIASGQIGLPPTQSVAFHLVEAWFDVRWHEPLREVADLQIFRPPPR